MATSYPTALDTLTNPTANDSLNSPSVPHATQHANANDAIEALQTTVGITNSADASSIQYKLAATVSVANSASSTASTALATAQAAMPNTTTAAGTLLYGATAKTTPVNADVLALSDSAASNVLKKLSWSDVKTTISTALESVFAKLAGLAGGQTLIGGTQPSENLTLQSTAHATRGKLLLGSSGAYDEVNVRLGVGTQAPSAKIHVIGTTEQERLGYDASNYYSVTVSSAGVVTHDATGAKHIFVGPAAANNTATMGAEMLTNSSFTSDLSSWTDSGSTWSWSAGGALHTAGTASNLSQNVSVVSGSTYEVRVNTSGRTAGTISVALGAVSFLESGSAGAFTAASFRRTAVANTTGTVALTITPSSTYDGKIDDISLKQVTLGTFPTSFAIGEGGLANFDVRGSMSSSSLYLGAGSGVSCTSSATNNVFLGISAGASNTTGYNNVFIGKSSGYSNTTAFQNTAVGLGSLVSCTSGCNNSAIGCYALYSTTTSNGAVAIGTNAAYSNVSGIGLVAIGVNAAYSQTTSYSTSIGYQSGRFLADGTTSLVTASNCCYIGASTKASADSVTNENVFGYNATGIGSNSTMIGSSAVTKCQIYGDMILDKTITAGGTTGAQTINKTCGSVNFAASATSLVVTNSRVTTSSVIVATVATNDSTMKTVTAVAGSGSFTLYANAAATAQTRVNWIVLN